MITLGVYLVGSGLTALTLGNGPLVVFLYAHPVHRRHGHRRRVRGDQLRDRRADPGPLPGPRRHRGQRHLLGRRDPRHARQLHPAQRASTRSLGWRIGFLIGPVLGLVILFVRRHLPESPRWQIMHGREEEAEEIDRLHRARGRGRPGTTCPGRREQGARAPADARRIGYLALPRVLFREYPSRSILGATLMITQSFLYNAIFFTYTLVLGKFYGVAVHDGADLPHRLRRRQPRSARSPSGTCSTPSAAGR